MSEQFVTYELKGDVARIGDLMLTGRVLTAEEVVEPGRSGDEYDQGASAAPAAR